MLTQYTAAQTCSKDCIHSHQDQAAKIECLKKCPKEQALANAQLMQKPKF